MNVELIMAVAMRIVKILQARTTAPVEVVIKWWTAIAVKVSFYM